MSYHFRTDIDEVRDILERMCDTLVKTPEAGSEGLKGAELRRTIGFLLAKLDALIRDGGFGEAVLACFTAAGDVGIRLTYMDKLINDLFEEDTVSLLATILTQACTVFALSQESRLISKMTFVSRDDVDIMMARMKIMFDRAKDVAADQLDSASYLALVELAAAVTNHLVTTGLLLPNVVHFRLAQGLPALALSQFIYHVGSRSEELIGENKVVNPVFVRPEVRALSA